MEAAPFFRDLADGPAGARSLWTSASDGTRLRLVLWPLPEAAEKDARGTVLLFSGRTEYAEKYGRAAADLARRGFATATIDWRGQGLSDRPLRDPNTGHVDDFAEYQHDVAALTAALRAAAMPQPWYLIAHSMGGAIGLRALSNGLSVQAAAFSAPMWGIRLSAATRPLAWTLARLGRRLGFGHRYAPGSGPVTYTAEAPFADNLLTTDPDMYAYMCRQVTERPELALGGPSLTWLAAALAECRALARLPAPSSLPAITFLGGNERIVDPAPIIARMADWPGGRLETVPRAEHEIMMESPPTRVHFFDSAAALFANRA